MAIIKPDGRYISFSSAVFLSAVFIVFGFIIEFINYDDKLSDARLTYVMPKEKIDAASKNEKTITSVISVKKEHIVTHIKTPTAVKAVYMSSWVAGTPSIRSRLVKLIKDTELNAVVIDVKDSTGMISFDVEGEYLRSFGSVEKRIYDVDGLIKELHDNNIYAIARIAAFQDPHLTKKRPDLAVYRKSDGKVWKDRKGLSWVDPGSEEIWDYLVSVGKYAYSVGFDELNFDYIRFPSDGNMNDIAYRHYDQDEMSRSEQMRKFFEYLNKKIKPAGIVISADLFGMTTTNKDDLNIGQILEDALANFDFVSPMVYPSHYPTGFHGYKNPAAAPYDIIKISMGEGVKKAIAANVSPNKLRPWLQDFDMGATYTADMVRAQMKATYDVGLTSWMLWDPSNKYTPSALIKELAQSTP